MKASRLSRTESNCPTGFSMSASTTGSYPNKLTISLGACPITKHFETIDCKYLWVIVSVSPERSGWASQDVAPRQEAQELAVPPKLSQSQRRPPARRLDCHEWGRRG